MGYNHAYTYTLDAEGVSERAEAELVGRGVPVPASRSKELPRLFPIRICELWNALVRAMGD